MPDYPMLPIITPPGRSSFPELPIVTPDPPRMSNREKYGGLYFLGVGGLAVLLALVAYFAVGLWRTRAVWTAFYVLSDASKPEADRVGAAWLLAHHPEVNDRQRVDLAFRKTLPDLARYVVAEGITADAIHADPKAYALMVARSEGWPDWLRLAMARPMAYAVGEGYRIAWEPIDQLRDGPDPMLGLWATYTRAVMGPGDPTAARALARAATRSDAAGPLAHLLDEAVRAEGQARVRKLDEATAWLRSHHPAVAPLWKGWKVEGDRIVPPPR